METCFENRELSWLRFNERVLEEAEDTRNPLCERLTFLSIFQSNLDEFFMVRIGSLHDQQLLDDESRDNKTNMTAGEQIEAALTRIRELCHRRDRCYAMLTEPLKEQGISLVNFHGLSAESELHLQQLFVQDLLPYLSPLIVGKKVAFPFLKNKNIYAVAALSTKAEKTKFGIVPCSDNSFPRLIALPDRPGCYILSEELILHYMPLMFPGYRVLSKTLVRVTRNADIDADAVYDEDMNYRDHMAEVIKRRQRLNPVRMELSRQIGEDIIVRLCEQLKLTRDRVFEYDTPLDVSYLFTINDTLRSHAELFYAPRHPQVSPDIDPFRPMLDQVLEHDIMLHYPYQSIRPFLRMLQEAAHDPRVTCIRMTLYRLARDSKVVESLVEAAESGKAVDVLVELKARFDEENNIEWSRRLERAGCHVIYGMEHIKVHSKLCQIVLGNEEDGTARYITQIGTGNYNEKTSRMYTDLSIMTANQEIGREGAMVFEQLCEGETVDHMQHLLVAPHCLQNKLLDLIDGEILKGSEGYIRLKLNSLTDKVLMDKLIEASCKQVRIDLIIRGICCLKAGVPGRTENVHIISVVGRFLEHSRIYMFGKGESLRCYISSADWMTRNTLRRVEVACPIWDPQLKQRLEYIFETIWTDNASARDMQPDGNYVRRMPGTEETRNCQAILYEQAYHLAAKREQ